MQKTAAFYATLRQLANHSNVITTRVVDSVMRISEASARMRLSNNIEKKDLDVAMQCISRSIIESLKEQDVSCVSKKLKQFY